MAQKAKLAKQVGDYSSAHEYFRKKCLVSMLSAIYCSDTTATESFSG